MQELDQDNLGEILKSNERVVVQYGAGWCGNCRLIKPKFKKMAAANENITFVYVDAEKFPGSREFAKIENLPTFAGFVGGELVKQNFGTKIEIVQEIVDEIAGH